MHDVVPLDFYAPILGLVVEIDGPCHDATIERDAERDALLRDRRLHIVRFAADDVEFDTARVVSVIKAKIDELAPEPKLLGWRAKRAGAPA